MPLWGDAWSDWHHIILRAPARLRQAVAHCPCRTSCAQEATKPWHVQYTSCSGHVFPLPISSVLTKGSAMQQTSRTLSYSGSRACACDGRRSGVALSFATRCTERWGLFRERIPPMFLHQITFLHTSQRRWRCLCPRRHPHRSRRSAATCGWRRSPPRRRAAHPPVHADRRYSRQMADQRTQDGVPPEHGPGLTGARYRKR